MSPIYTYVCWMVNISNYRFFLSNNESLMIFVFFLLSFYMCLHQRASSKIYLTLAVVSWFWRVIAFSDCICKSNWRRMLIYDATAHLSNKYYTCSHQRFLEDAMHMRHYKCFSEDSVALHKNGYVVHCCAGLCGRG